MTASLTDDGDVIVGRRNEGKYVERYKEGKREDRSYVVKSLVHIAYVAKPIWLGM